MAKQINETPTSKPSDTPSVDAYMNALNHPLKSIAEELRTIILNTHKVIGEEIAWNAPCFFYTGEMKPFKAKEYKRYVVGYNLFKKDCVRLVFLRGGMVNDSYGILEGDYADGRRLAMFYSMEDLVNKKKALQKVIKDIIKLIAADA